ncbi:glycerol uptake facilitator protein [Streptococcus rupicaprae]|uniref:Aquaporin family protein n=2 Tax=Streptococcus TaxID=1301 RepID=A0A7X6S0L8_9STRE|nr:MIP/aquaporin family protein [Streptococcus ovuberis]NKZ20239.1 aquaporin family protein [Streptococcus ovuberis]
MQYYIGEFLGTMVLIALGAGFGSSISLNHSLSKNLSPNFLTITIAWGFAVMFGVSVAGFFETGGHLNPAVTLAFALGGLFDWSMVAGYIIAQLLGAFVGSAIVVVHYYPHFMATKPEEGNTVGIFATTPAISTPFFNLISEIIATFFFIFILLLMNTGSFVAGVAPISVAFLVMAIGLSFGSTTGYAINPARDFGPRLAYAILPIPNKGEAHWDYAWIPILAPIIGATLAVFVFQCLVS